MQLQLMSTISNLAIHHLNFLIYIYIFLCKFVIVIHIFVAKYKYNFYHKSCLAFTCIRNQIYFCSLKLK